MAGLSIVFNGFRSLSANFTPTPNQFFDEVLGHYPYCVVAVVGILIRSTLGWEDPDTGERRIESELPLSAFIRPELSESSARRGLSEAMTARLIVRTASSSSREGARYALRWTDDEAQQRAINRARRAAEEPGLFQQEPGQPLGTPTTIKLVETPAAETGRGVKLTPLMQETRGVNLRGVKLTPPYTKKINKSLKKINKEQTLNVGEEVNYVDVKEPEPSELISQSGNAFLEKQASALVEELRDWGSERRHRQLLSLCDQHGLSDLPTQALHATRQRQSREQKRGLLANPGAYYVRILLKLLEDRQVFVPTAGEDDPEEVRRIIGQSLGLVPASETSTQPSAIPVKTR